MMEKPIRVLLHNEQTAGMEVKLKAKFPQVEVSSCQTYAGLPEQIDTFQPDVVYTVRFAGSVGYPRDALFGPGGPKWIANGGAGTDHFGSWDTSAVTVTNAAGVAADMMAEYIMGGFLHFTLDVPGLKQDQEDRTWKIRQVRPLKGKTLLIIGLGNTGRALAERANAFGMYVIGTRARPVAMEHVDEVAGSDDLPRLLPKADFVAVCTPLTPETTGLLSEKEFSAMKQGVILADVSRGKVINQAALLNALEKGTIAGAALDVFETEPLPPENPLWDFPNVLISPHCSSVHAGWEDASFDLFMTNLRNWLNQEPLFNVVDPQRGY